MSTSRAVENNDVDTSASASLTVASTTCTAKSLPTFIPPTHSLSACLQQASFPESEQHAADATANTTKCTASSTQSKSNSKSKSRSKGRRNQKKKKSATTMSMMHSNLHKYSYFNPKPQNRCIGSAANCSAVYLICDDCSIALCDKLPADKHKYSMFWQLLQAYKLNNAHLFGNKLQIISAHMASKQDLLCYHDENYVDLLERVEDYPSYSEQSEEEKQVLQEYGLMDDCPIFDGVYEYSLFVAGASLQCAQLIKQEKTRIAMNFMGGRHHALSSKARGYCYVNDIVLCIDSLRNDEQHRFDRILYIDLDLHHGDAIQQAYYRSNQVFVVSIHHKDVDFFPQSGDKHEYGEKHGLFYNLNVPICNGLKLKDEPFCDIVSKICHRLNYFFQPDCVVVCCGCDGLQSDPNRKWNLSINALCKAVNIIVTHMDKPTILLGGGGYNAVDTAKCWTKIVAQTATINITNDIPYHDNFKLYAPHYLLSKLSNTASAAADNCNDNLHNNNKNKSKENENENECKKKQQRSNLQALQLIYAHLNNFERLFVQKNLKTQSANRKSISHGSSNRAKKNKERKRNKVDAQQTEQESKDKEDDVDMDMDIDRQHNVSTTTHTNTSNDNALHAPTTPHEQDESEDSDLAANQKKEMEIASDSKKRLIQSVSTNTCRSRRKRRKI